MEAERLLLQKQMSASKIAVAVTMEYVDAMVKRQEQNVQSHLL